MSGNSTGAYSHSKVRIRTPQKKKEVRIGKEKRRREKQYVVLDHSMSDLPSKNKKK
jgi:hypothetical protein